MRLPADARRAHLPLALLALALPGAALAAPPDDEPRVRWSDFLSRAEVGADAWSRAHPKWDGTGVVIAVLDTGIDPSVPGLTRLPNGDVKVIEARDFSGQGHVSMARATVDGEVLRQGSIVVRGALALPEKPLRKNDFWLGAFDEKALRNSAVEDIDGNGRSDDRFAVLAFRRAPAGDEVVVVDTDGDGDLSDEKVMHAYAVDPEWFTFGSRSKDPRANKAPVVIAATPVLDEKRVELHFDDGAHGTHCAGIAAGHGIDGKPGFDGIAPGARLMSLKIGHNALAGGATTRGAMAEAIRFASRWAKDNRTPVVMNISYGVGSDVEGASEIERVLDEALQDNRWLLASLSAGNEGPGLSSVGTPASAPLAWAAGALVPDGAWEVLYGAKRPSAKKKIFAFSSRGGELDKPDGLTPGVAWSTVPPYRQRSVMNGTSMASPQAAGVKALLVSAALAEGKAWTPGLVKRAMRHSAKKLPGYSSLEQGAGLVDVRAAWELLRKHGGAAGAGEVAGWKVSTPVPGRPGTVAQVSYWRVGGYAPERDERVAFKVEPRFYGDVSELARGRHVDVFELDSDVGWLDVDRGTVAIRGESATEILVRVDRSALSRSGQHVGRVRAKVGGLTAFELPVVVIVPERFSDGWERAFEGRLEPGDVARVFVEVPPGATAMEAELVVPQAAYGQLWLVPFSPAGHHVEAYEHKASSVDAQVASFRIGGAELEPGTWELTVIAPLQARAVSRFDLTVRFVALAAPEVVKLVTGPDGRSKASLELVNGMAEPFRGAIDATIDAYEREREVEVSGERAEVPLAIAPGVTGVELRLEVAGAVWDRMSDIALNVVDQSGRAVAQGAFGQRRTHLEVEAPPGRYTLEIVGGLVARDGDGAWKVRVQERHRLAAPIAMRVDAPEAAVVGTRHAALYPGVESALTLGADAVPAAPDGFLHRVALSFTRRDGSIWTTLALPLTRP